MSDTRRARQTALCTVCVHPGNGKKNRAVVIQDRRIFNATINAVSKVWAPPRRCVWSCDFFVYISRHCKHDLMPIGKHYSTAASSNRPADGLPFEAGTQIPFSIVKDFDFFLTIHYTTFIRPFTIQTVGILQ
jgi:hypothetical protein